MAHSAFPMNAWYAAGWDLDVKRDLLPRTICGISIVLYRRFDRSIAALEDACWHRLLPLSMGRLSGDEVVCGYHGLVFNSDGRCVRMPSEDRISPNACVRAFPVVERHRLVWIWPGDSALADPALIPDMHWADDAEWAGEGSYFDLKCDYRLVLDNLMDLTHETFVHTTSIGDDAVAGTPLQANHEGRTVDLSRWMIDVEAPPFLATQLCQAHDLAEPGKVDRWQLIHFEAPATIVIDVGVAPTGSGAREGDRSKGISGRVLNTVTPQTADTCYYFFQYARCYGLDDRALSTEMKEANIRIFTEDKIILEAQQRAAVRHPDRPFVNLKIDVGSVRARRAIEQMIAAERAEDHPGGA
ncbi:MAG: rieske [2Fe-2S] domain protein [Rhodospirillales bacterium]|jgi:phenylpropionate dioxygenase-like ring-hydroxylating dioxygenase large terminal subunit|nr:rieske [2Fe-2S] domain protein [Rhodospirillales bacterium]